MVPAGGYVKEQTDIKQSMERLRKYIHLLPSKLPQIPQDELLKKPAPGKWSKQEILGHLIDSALNNLKRFTDIQHAKEPYVIQSYQQHELVMANNYQHLPLEPLIELWQALNKQILNVVDIIPQEKLSIPVDPQYDNREMRTLAWVICDYVAHMEHHLAQIFPGFVVDN